MLTDIHGVFFIENIKFNVDNGGYLKLK